MLCECLTIFLDPTIAFGWIETTDGCPSTITREGTKYDRIDSNDLLFYDVLYTADDRCAAIELHLNSDDERKVFGAARAIPRTLGYITFDSGFPTIWLDGNRPALGRGLEAFGAYLYRSNEGAIAIMVEIDEWIPSARKDQLRAMAHKTYQGRYTSRGHQ